MGAVVFDRVFDLLARFLERVNREFPVAAVIAAVVLHLVDLALELFADAEQIAGAAALATEVDRVGWCGEALQRLASLRL